MKIGVISDTHGSLTAWQKVMAKFFSQVDMIIHCGDVLYHGPRNPLPEGYAPAELAKAINKFHKPLVCAQGNCDAEVDQLLLEIPIQSPYAQIHTSQWRILVHHGHALPENELPEWTRHFNLIISGHTHIPAITQHAERILLNPGSPALPKNKEKAPTIALINGSTIQLWNIQTGELLQEVSPN